MTVREKIQARQAERERFDDSRFNRALVRAGFTILAGYLFGTLIGWLITR